MNPEYNPTIEFGEVHAWQNSVNKKWLIRREFNPNEPGIPVYQYFMPNGNPSGHWTWSRANALMFDSHQAATAYWMERLLTA